MLVVAFVLRVSRVVRDYGGQFGLAVEAETVFTGLQA